MVRIRALAVVSGGIVAMLAAVAVPGAWGQVPPPASSTTTVPADGSTTSASTTPTTVDPNADAPNETVPPVTVTVPPREPDPGAADSTPVTEPPGHVVYLNVRAARAASLAARANLDEVSARRSGLEAQLAALQARVAALDAQARQAVADVARARDELARRAVDAYMRGPSEDDGSPALTDHQLLRGALFDTLIWAGDTAVSRFRAAKARVNVEQANTAVALASTMAAVEHARVEEEQARLDLRAAAFAFAVTSAGGDVVIHGFVFPVARPYTFSDTFGDPRLPDTPLAHPHMGADIGAAEGTELYACERGVIMTLTSGGLGGTGLFLKGESGTVYYYAHLSAYADGLAAGQVVLAGERVGFVGHTGDAAASGPHLHFEIHPNGGDAIDPYPVLKAADEVSDDTR